MSGLLNAKETKKNVKVHEGGSNVMLKYDWYGFSCVLLNLTSLTIHFIHDNFFFFWILFDSSIRCSFTLRIYKNNNRFYIAIFEFRMWIEKGAQSTYGLHSYQHLKQIHSKITTHIRRNKFFIKSIINKTNPRMLIKIGEKYFFQKKIVKIYLKI